MLVRIFDADGVETGPWRALRLESDGRLGQNSWLLNHPIHHFQLGICDDFRAQAARGRSLLSFVDAAIRAFVPTVWGELYPSLFLALTEPAGQFSLFTQPVTGREVELRAAHAARLQNMLRAARAEGNVDWYQELNQWRDDVDARSELAPELYDLFAEPE